MITFPKIKAASYAIGKRLQGYHLLQNPSGTPQTEVNMVKENFYGTTSLWDDVFHITRLKRTFSKGENYTEERFLMSTHYMDVHTMQMTKPRKKNIYYSVQKDGSYTVLKDREDMAWEISEKRKVPKLSHKWKNFMGYNSEYDKKCMAKRHAQWGRGYYKTHYPLLTKFLSLGMHKRMSYPSENRPNFFKVLYHNLTNRI
jgi:hypothetical protein